MPLEPALRFLRSSGDGVLFGEVPPSVCSFIRVRLSSANACFGGGARGLSAILFPSLYEGHFAAAVFGLLRRVGRWCRTNQQTTPFEACRDERIRRRPGLRSRPSMCPTDCVQRGDFQRPGGARRHRCREEAPRMLLARHDRRCRDRWAGLNVTRSMLFCRGMERIASTDEHRIRGIRAGADAICPFLGRSRRRAGRWDPLSP